LRELGSKDDPLQSMIDDAPRHIDENLDPHFFQLPMEMFAEAARNPKIAEAMRATDVAAMAEFRPSSSASASGAACRWTMSCSMAASTPWWRCSMACRSAPCIVRTWTATPLWKGYRVAMKALLLT
jgi:hypothetical protein